MKLTKTLGALSFAAAVALTATGCGGGGSSVGGLPQTQTQTGQSNQSQDVSEAKSKAALEAYADLAIKGYTDALSGANAMLTAINAFTATPSAATLDAAKTAWKTARETYGITEIFRLSNGPIDAEDGFAASFGAPEGQLNAWPLDEAMVDSMVLASTANSTGSIIATAGTMTSFTNQEGDTAVLDTPVDTTTITKTVIADLNENGGDANVATGYHAIEFLLWGQDQDYENFLTDSITNGATKAGERPVTDYTNGSPEAQRRKDYLKAAAELIIDDLQSMVDAWTTGGYKEALIGNGSNAIAQKTALKQIMAGMGVFLKSELANERIGVALLTPSEEDEHSCFSDNTHRDIDLNYKGFKNALDIFKVNLSDAEQATINTMYASIDAKVKTINDTAATKHFDYQIMPGDSSNANINAAKNELRDLGDEMINVAKEYGVSLNEGDVTDPDETAL